MKLSVKFPIAVRALESYLPHRAPAVWVDEVLWVDDGGGACGVHYFPNAPYAKDEGLTETCFIEWVAQSFGFIKAAQFIARGSTPGPDETHISEAFLAAISKFEIFARPRPLSVGSLFEIKVYERRQLGALVLIEGKVFFEKQLLAAAELKIFTR